MLPATETARLKYGGRFYVTNKKRKREQRVATLSFRSKKTGGVTVPASPTHAFAIWRQLPVLPSISSVSYIIRYYYSVVKFDTGLGNTSLFNSLVNLLKESSLEEIHTG